MGKLTATQQTIANTLARRSGVSWKPQGEKVGFTYRAVLDGHDYDEFIQSDGAACLQYASQSEPEGSRAIRYLTMTDSQATSYLQAYAREQVLREARERAATR